MKVIDVVWFTGMYGCCGIVLGEDAITGQRKAYIGVYRGQGEAEDTELVAAGGTKFTLYHAQRIVEHLEGR